MKKIVYGAIASASCFLVVFSLHASAQSAIDLEAKLNQSQICAPLKFDVIDVAKLLGLSIPDIPIPVDTTIGWDKNEHTVISLAVNVDHKLSSTLELGCQPSSEAAVLKILNLTPDQVRLRENVSCNATVGQDGSVPNLMCNPSGEAGKLLGAITDLNGQLKPIFQAVLAPH
jgi:hypothetical protein